jgi:hypothetical protein
LIEGFVSRADAKTEWRGGRVRLSPADFPIGKSEQIGPIGPKGPKDKWLER